MFEKIPASHADGLVERSFSICVDKHDNKLKKTNRYRLIPCNFNAVDIVSSSNDYTSGYINGRATTILVRTECNTYNDEFTYYKFPKLLVPGDDQSLLMRNDNNINVDHMTTYGNKLKDKVLGDCEMSPALIKRGKDLIFSSLSEFINNETDDLAGKDPFMKGSLNRDLLAKMMNLRSRYTGFDGQYMYESKVTFMLNILVNSLNHYLSTFDVFADINAVECVLSKIVIKKENCWMLGNILKLECQNVLQEICSVFSIISGASDHEYNDIFEIPQKLWLNGLSDPVQDKVAGYVKAFDSHGRAIYVKYKTYDDMEDYLSEDGNLMLLDIMPISASTAIFKLVHIERMESMIIRDIQIGDDGVKTYVIKTTEYSEYAMMAISRLRDMLLFITKLAIFDYDVFLKKEKHAADPTSMQRYFRVLFHRAYISQHITTMFDIVFDMMMNYLVRSPECGPESPDFDEGRLSILNARLNVISDFINVKLADLGLHVNSPNIDRALFQIVDIYKYDMLLLPL